MYKINKSFGVETGIVRIQDGAFIPANPDNTDYQAYLAWVAQGNQPTSADEVTL
jgi:hypothetical protein